MFLFEIFGLCSFFQYIIRSERDRQVITMSVSLLWLLELGNIDCSLGDMILTARDRRMITNEGLLL